MPFVQQIELYSFLLCHTGGYVYVVYCSYLSVLLFVTHSVTFEWNRFVWIIGLKSTVLCYLYLLVSSAKNRICCWCNSLSLNLFAKDFKKQSLNELISLKIRSLISVIICNLRFSSSTLRFKAPSKFDWRNVSLHNVLAVASLASSINWLDCTVAWLQSTEFWPDVKNSSLTC